MALRLRDVDRLGEGRGIPGVEVDLVIGELSLGLIEDRLLYEERMYVCLEVR